MLQNYVTLNRLKIKKNEGIFSQIQWSVPVGIHTDAQWFVSYRDYIPLEG